MEMPLLDDRFPIKAIPVLTKHDRERSTVTAESNEKKKNVG